GLVKDERHKTSELLYGEEPRVVPLDRKSQAFYLVQRIQDEVHRFAITFHRQLRGKSVFQSELDKIPGVGEKRRKSLLQHFKTTDVILKASLEGITKVDMQKNGAKNIHDYLNQ